MLTATVQVDFKAKKIAKDKKEHYIMVKDHLPRRFKNPKMCTSIKELQMLEQNDRTERRNRKFTISPWRDFKLS